MDFTGKNVLITGGSRGIGRATALAFAERGARVAINFKGNTEAAAETMELLGQEKDHFAIKADISDPRVAEWMVNAVAQEFGRLDIVVNNAGIYEYHPLEELSYEEWQEAWQNTLQVNLVAVSNICYCAASQMIEEGGGRIVNVSSRGAFRGEPLAPAYGASKAGLNAMSQSLAQQLAKHNIYVGVVAPGFVETDMAEEILEGPEGDNIRNQSPLGRVAQPEEVAQAILFLAADGSEFMTGGIIDVNGASYLRS